MRKISQAECQEGLTAYEQVQAFAALRRKKLPLVYIFFPIVLATAGVSGGLAGSRILAVVCIGSAMAFAAFAFWNWRRLRSQDERNRALLARLQAQHGDDLPWLEVERQMAEIRRIQVEVAKRHEPDSPR